MEDSAPRGFDSDEIDHNQTAFNHVDTKPEDDKARDGLRSEDTFEKGYGKDKRNKRKRKGFDAKNLPPVPEGMCSYFLVHKSRYCRFRPNAGAKYCVEHSFQFGEGQGRKRVCCPINPSHSCYEDQLEKHIKKCNFREDSLPVYHVKNINSGHEEEDEISDDMKVSCVDVPLEELVKLVKKVEKLCDDCKIEPTEEILFHPVLQEEVDKEFNGPAARKHLLQQASLVGHLEAAGLLHDKAIYVEFGAGKGALSHWVQLALKDCKNTSFLPVEKCSVRYKKDSYHKGADQGPSFERLRMDIEHLDLCHVPVIQEKLYPVVGMGKHLCGAATDFALRCLMNAVEPSTNHANHTEDSAENVAKHVEGIMLAMCCHHRVEWRSYVGKQFFHTHDMGPREFYVLRHMTSWATCGAEKVLKGTDSDHSAKEYNHFRYGSMTPQYRAKIGMLCKHIIDQGRIDYLHSQGFRATMKKYTSTATSVENVAIIATKTYGKEENSNR